jgi:AraC-like DNA-binding protein
MSKPIRQPDSTIQTGGQYVRGVLHDLVYRPRPETPGDGPYYRTLVCGETREYAMRKRSALFLDALEPGGEGVWIYTLAGHAHYRLGNERHRLEPGRVFAVRKPDQGWLVRDPSGLPWHYLWVNVCGNESLRLFQHILRRAGSLHSIPQTSTAIAAARRLINAARRQPVRSAHEWSLQTFQFLNAWWQAAEEAVATPPLDAPTPRASRLSPVTPASVKGFARSMGYSRSYMQAKLKQQWGRSPGMVIREVRLQEAARLLQSSDLDVADIAERVGFTESTSLTRAFRRAFGMSPSAYRRQSQG